MDKILVTTDFSSSSKAGLRFAIQLASQHKYELVFFHAYNLTKPISMSEDVFLELHNKETEKLQKKLHQFVTSIYKSLKITALNYSCIVKKAYFIDSSIIEYARDNNFSFICISTRGAGKLKSILGTNTFNLINHSTVPVIAVPQNYRKSKITTILYATDLINLENEFLKVVAFTKPLKAKLELLHFCYPIEENSKMKKMQEVANKFLKHEIKLHIKNSGFTESFISNIERAIKQSKPSMMIMFTQQNRSFFEKIFNPSKSAKSSFTIKVPILVFQKM